MSSRPLITPHLVITNASMAPGAPTVSQPSIVQMVSMPCYQATWTGTAPVGTLQVQGSNDFRLDKAGKVANAGTWTAMYFSINGSAPTNMVPVSGNTGSALIDIETSVYAIRIVYTPVSGTGTLNVNVVGKVS